MPIGIHDFKKVVEEGYFFVDKTTFIADVLEQSSEVTLITRPRRFGKTLNLSMLRYFLDAKEAESNRKLFDNLAVKDHPKAMEAMGQYPVLMLSLKGMKASNLDGQLGYIKTLMRDLYEEHRYLYQHLSASEKLFFDHVCQKEIDEPDLGASLKKLIQFMARYSQRKVVVLIDEYDQPLLRAFYRGFEKDFQDFYRGFMGNALKDNSAVQFAVVTGIMQMAGSGLFSDFNNVDMYTLLDERFATAFGFTEADVRAMLLMDHQEAKLEEVKKWYNGYLFGKKGHVMYNPWSVLQYVSRDYEPDAYWVHTSDNVLLQKELSSISDATCAKFTALMTEGGKISVVLDKDLRFSEVGIEREEALWVLLLSSGYLKARVQSTALGGSIQADLFIPNEEVRFIYHRLFRSWLSQKLGLTNDSASLLTLLTQGEVETFCHMLETHFLQSVSVHDVRTDTIESFYHGFVLSLLSLINRTHIGQLRSNGESGLGRFDMTLEPKDVKSSPGIVFELKRLDPAMIKEKTTEQIKQSLKSAAEEGLMQIKSKAYDTDLVARGVQKIAYVSLAFSGKQMAYQCEGPFAVDR